MHLCCVLTAGATSWIYGKIHGTQKQIVSKGRWVTAPVHLHYITLNYTIIVMARSLNRHDCDRLQYSALQTLT